MTTTTAFTSEFVQQQLTTLNKKSKAHAKALYDSRVRRRQLVLASKKPQPQPRPSSSDAGRRMGRREAAEKGLWKLRDDQAKCVCALLTHHPETERMDYRWEKFLPLHRLWIGYMTELLLAGAEDMRAKLVKADFHGSIMTGACVG